MDLRIGKEAVGVWDVGTGVVVTGDICVARVLIICGVEERRIGWSVVMGLVVGMVVGLVGR